MPRIVLLLVASLFVGCVSAPGPAPLEPDGSAPVARKAVADDLEDAILVASLGPAPIIGLGSFNPAILTASSKDGPDGAAGAEPTPSGSGGNSDLARQAQNPIANLISLPIQNNTSFGLGPYDRIQNVTNIQPVVPVNFGDWNIITRTIAPLIYQPNLTQNSGGDYGLGDINFTAFLSPSAASEVTWGAGPTISMPIATKDTLGSDKWSAGPSGVVLWMTGPWVVGCLVNNLWSFAGSSRADSVNQMLLQYFVNYNLEDGWYLTSAPIMTANWKAKKGGDVWTVPVGGGIGKVFKIGTQAINASVQGYYVANSPSIGPDWQLRLQIQFLFPK